MTAPPMNTPPANTPLANPQDPMISDRTRITKALTTEEFVAVDYIPAPNAKPAPLEFVIDGTIERRNLPATVSINSGEAYVAACEAGFGIIQVPFYHVARQLAADSLREILPDCRPPALPLNVLYPPNRQLSARVRAFIDWLEALFGGELAASRS